MLLFSSDNDLCKTQKKFVGLSQQPTVEPRSVAAEVEVEDKSN